MIYFCHVCGARFNGLLDAKLHNDEHDNRVLTFTDAAELHAWLDEQDRAEELGPEGLRQVFEEALTEARQAGRDAELNRARGLVGEEKKRLAKELRQLDQRASYSMSEKLRAQGGVEALERLMGRLGKAGDG